MKLMINDGPYVEGEDCGFEISTEHCNQIGSFLRDWKDSLPHRVGCRIEIITVNPTRKINVPMSVIRIKVILSGSGGKGWKTEFEQEEFYSPSDGAPISAKDLFYNLRGALKQETQKYQSMLDELNSMVESLSVSY